MDFVKKMSEVVMSVIPIVIIVLILHFTIAPLDALTLQTFTIGAIMVVLGLGIFNFGVDVSMVPMGEEVGAAMTKRRSLALVLILGFLTGFMVTIADPDLQLLAQQVFQASEGMVSHAVLMVTVSVGLGLTVALALLRILLQIPISRVLLFLWIVIFALAAIVTFVAPDFLSVAFDSGGVTTGPLTIPFILALGVGVASVRGDKKAEDDSFGLVGLACTGPVIAVLALGLIFGGAESSQASISAGAEAAADTGLWMTILATIRHELSKALIALSPIVVIFIGMQLTLLKLSRRALRRICIGLVFTLIGLVLFLTGVNAGFSGTARELGQDLAFNNSWALIPVGVILGFSVVFAEPSVYVLNSQVEEVTGGYVNRRIILGALGISVAAAVGLSMLRIRTGSSIWWFVLPGYAFAFLIMRKSPPLFTAIAFDSGGVATGPMTATFVLALAIGASQGLGGNVLADAFGVVAMVAMMPIIVLQAVGMIYESKTKKVRLLEEGQEV